MDNDYQFTTPPPTPSPSSPPKLKRFANGSSMNHNHGSVYPTGMPNYQFILPPSMVDAFQDIAIE